VLKLLPALLPWWVAGPRLVRARPVRAGEPPARGLRGLAGGGGRPIEGWRGERWRAEFLAALIGGALVAGVLGSATRLTGYPVLSRNVPAVVLLPVLAVGGLALGYGARCAEGCTSGHGLSGCAAGSPDSLAVAVAVTFAAHALTGGAL